MTTETPKPRQLHVTWIDAGERRLVSRALYQYGFSQGHIARLLNVSQQTICKDVGGRRHANTDTIPERL